MNTFCFAEFPMWFIIVSLAVLVIGEGARWGRAALSAYRMWQLRRTPEYKALLAMLGGPPANDNVVRVDSGFLQMPPRGRQ
jgi:hypothetical protein